MWRSSASATGCWCASTTRACPSTTRRPTNVTVRCSATRWTPAGSTRSTTAGGAGRATAPCWCGPSTRRAIATPTRTPIDSRPTCARLPDDLAVTPRIATAADVEEICRLTWRTYGATYQHDEYYMPDRLAAMLESGAQTSFVVTLDGGEVLGHSAVLLEEPGALIVEAGRAMVDPRARGHHLMGAVAGLRTRWLSDHGVLAIGGAAVTAHTRSQTGGPVTNVQLAFLPPVEFRDIDGSDTPRREAVLGGMVPCAPIPAQEVHLPARDAEVIEQLYGLLDLDRPVRTPRQHASRRRRLLGDVGRRARRPRPHGDGGRGDRGRPARPGRGPAPVGARRRCRRHLRRPATGRPRGVVGGRCARRAGLRLQRAAAARARRRRPRPLPAPRRHRRRSRGDPRQERARAGPAGLRARPARPTEEHDDHDDRGAHR